MRLALRGGFESDLGVRAESGSERFLKIREVRVSQACFLVREPLHRHFVVVREHGDAMTIDDFDRRNFIFSTRSVQGPSSNT